MSLTQAAMEATATAIHRKPPTPPKESGSIVISIMYWGLYWTYLVGFWLLGFATITLPRTLFSILHWSGFISVELNFQKLVILFMIFAIASSYAYKLKVLNKYSLLPATEPLSKGRDESLSDLHPDVANSDPSKSHGFHNYLDEFLSAIRVFGFLEKPVFQEIARHLQTRRLLAGDTLNLNHDKSFYIVMDGTVQVFAKTLHPDEFANGTFRNNDSSHAYETDDRNGFQLLNEVESGGTLSSLFTILSLFTEDVNLRYEDKASNMSSATANSHYKPVNRLHRTTSVGGEGRLPDALGNDVDVTKWRLESDSDTRLPGLFGLPLTEKSPTNCEPISEGEDGSSTEAGSGHEDTSATPSLGNKKPLFPSSGYFPHHVNDKARKDNSAKPTRTNPAGFFVGPTSPNGASASASVSGIDTPLGYPDHGRAAPAQDYASYGASIGLEPRELTVARATCDTTLAVIPAEAFRKLTKKFPDAAAHIVQVILTRLQRVTILTSHKYLGLTKDVIRTEKAFNDLACYPLPASFYESGGMERLRARFAPETRLVDDVEENDYFAVLPTPWDGPKNMFATEFYKKTQHSAGSKISMRRRSSKSARFQADASTFSPETSQTTALHRREDAHRSSMSSSKIEISSGLPSPSKRHASRRPLNLSGLSTNVNDFDLRGHVMDCIAKSIGLHQTPFSPPVSVEASPFIAPLRPSFKSGLGSLSFLGTLGLDEESTVASSVTNQTPIPLELENAVEILFFPRGSTLVQAGERNAGLYFVIDGFLDVVMPLSDTEQTSAVSKFQGRVPKGAGVDAFSNSKAANWDQADLFEASFGTTDGHQSQHAETLFTVKPGGIAGYLASICGTQSYVDIRSKTDAYVGFLPAKALEAIIDKKPIILLTLAKRLISLLSPLVLHIDSALEWMAVDSGKVIYRKDDRSNNLYIVISGRLRTIEDNEDGRVEILQEYGQGDSIGELDSITGSPRSATLHAIRDSELVRIPMTLFNAISLRHPEITLKVSRLIASRVKAHFEAAKSPSFRPTGGSELGKNNFNLKTVAIIPITRQIPLVRFAGRLKAALESIGASTSYLNQATVLAVLGRHAFSRIGKLKLASWLAENEQKHRLVMYVCDAPVNAPWTQTCIKQADCILLISDGGANPEVGEYERMLLTMKTTARKELVLLHPDRNVPAGSTRPWLKVRPWVHAHHHVEMEGCTPLADFEMDEPQPVIVLRNLKERVQTRLRKTAGPSSDQGMQLKVTDDFPRLARRLCGKSIGIVLGGGGARGIAHIGVLRALQEEGIPIDMVGGTSIGSLVGGLYARNADLIATLGRTKTFAGRMSTLWRIMTDLTYPVVAYTTGHEFNRGIYKAFRNVHIEDFWLPFWTNTTSLRWSRMQIHTTGYAWRYIRASMSLAGLLPPLCDDGDMLVDGGYVDNLPVSVMISQGADSIFAVDVGSIDDTSPRHFGETISGWYLLFNRWNPWSQAASIPTMTDIQSRLTYISSVKTLEEAKATPGVLYMRMPTESYATMDFKKFSEIHDVGYQAAKKMLKQFKQDDRLPTGMLVGFDILNSTVKRGLSARRNSI